MSTQLRPGDTVVFASGGRMWTVDNVASTGWGKPELLRLVSMSDGGLLQEVVVSEKTVVKAYSNPNSRRS